MEWEGVKAMGRGWAVLCTGLLCFAASYVLALWFAQQYGLFSQPAPPNSLRIDLAAEQAKDSTPGPGWEDLAAASEQLYVGIHDQHVAIFRGKPGMGGVVVEKTEIPIAKLPEFEIRSLRTGIPFTDEEHKHSILEGLHFPL